MFFKDFNNETETEQYEDGVQRIVNANQQSSLSDEESSL